MLKPAVTILLMAVILIQALGKWIVILEYEINKDYIAKNLCINRTMPARCCKGKCFLQKKLADDDGQEQSSGKSAQREDNRVEFFLNKIVKIDFALPAFIHQHNFFYLNGKSQEFIPSFFRPPQC